MVVYIIKETMIATMIIIVLAMLLQSCKQRLVAEYTSTVVPVMYGHPRD